MLIGNEMRQHVLKDSAMDELAASVIGVVDRVGLLPKVQQILFSDVTEVFGGRGKGSAMATANINSSMALYLIHF